MSRINRPPRIILPTDTQMVAEALSDARFSSATADTSLLNFYHQLTSSPDPRIRQPNSNNFAKSLTFNKNNTISSANIRIDYPYNNRYYFFLSFNTVERLVAFTKSNSDELYFTSFLYNPKRKGAILNRQDIPVDRPNIRKISQSLLSFVDNHD